MTKRTQFLSCGDAITSNSRGAGAAAALVRCPGNPEETVELYLLGHLNVAESAYLRTHFSQCRECRGILTKITDFISALQAAVDLEHTDS